MTPPLTTKPEATAMLAALPAMTIRVAIVVFVFQSLLRIW